MNFLLLFKGKRTHEEIFELIFINVMREVANKKLLAVWVADNSPVVHISRVCLPPSTCRTGLQPEISSHETDSKNKKYTRVEFI